MSKYFAAGEMMCKCGCGLSDMDASFMLRLDDIRAAVGKPFVVASAYRCPKHNNEVSRTGLNGPHTTGRAVDIRAGSRLKYEILREATKRGVSRVGVARTFIHIDNLSKDDGFSENVIWNY